jgi:hypothetical protein
MSITPRYAALVLALLCISEARAAASPLPAPKTGFVTANGIKLHYLDWVESVIRSCSFPASTTVHMYTTNSLRALLIAST